MHRLAEDGAIGEYVFGALVHVLFNRRFHHLIPFACDLACASRFDLVHDCEDLGWVFFAGTCDVYGPAFLMARTTSREL